MPPPADNELAIQTRQAAMEDLKKQLDDLRAIVAAGRVVQFSDLIKFDGQNGKYWLQRFETFAKDNLYDEAKKLSIFPNYLDSNSHKWFCSLPQTDKDTWAKLEKSFQVQYVKERPRHTVIDELQARLMGHDEEIEDYVAAIRLLCCEAKCTEEELKGFLIQNSRKDICEKLAKNKDKSVNDLISLAKEEARKGDSVYKLIKDLQRSMDELKKSNVAAVQEAAAAKPAQQSNYQAPRHNQQTSWRGQSKRCGKCNSKFCRSDHNCKARGAACHFCNRIGHFQSVCWNAKRGHYDK